MNIYIRLLILPFLMVTNIMLDYVICTGSNNFIFHMVRDYSMV